MMLKTYVILFGLFIIVVLIVKVLKRTKKIRRQNEYQVFTRIGGHSSLESASDYAGAYLPYVLFAIKAYGNRGSDGYRWDEFVKLERDIDPDNGNSRSATWLQGWEKVDEHDEHDDPLPAPLGSNKQSLGGLGYQIWVSRKRNEIVVAFRGTDFDQMNDWISNFRWLRRLFPQTFDQYAQVHLYISEILDKAVKTHGVSDPRIVSVGHSLGGGLAQQAAYADKRIRKVYAFNPSIVTGFRASGEAARKNAEGLEIDRIYQRGEILAFVRFAGARIVRPPSANPQVKLVRFNFLADRGWVYRHGINVLSLGLLAVAGAPAEWEARKTSQLIQS